MHSGGAYQKCLFASFIMILQSKNKGECYMTYTWKVVYVPKVMNGGMRGVAFVEAATQAEASWAFKQQYAGQFSTIERIEKFC